MQNDGSGARRGRPPKNLSTNTTAPKPAPRYTANELLSSNLTSGHFLGSKDRPWMRSGTLTKSSAYIPRPAVTTASSTAQTPRLPHSTQVSPPKDTAQMARQDISILNDSVVPEKSTEVTVQPTNAPVQAQSANEAEVVDLTLASQLLLSQDQISPQPNADPITRSLSLHRNDAPDSTEPRHLPEGVAAPGQASTQNTGPPTNAMTTAVANGSHNHSGAGLRYPPPIPISASLWQPPSVKGPVDLNGFSAPSPITTTPQPSAQLLTPVASPEQLNQHLHHKRSSEITHPSQPPQTRLRTNSTHQVPLSGYIPHQPNITLSNQPLQTLSSPFNQNQNRPHPLRQPSLSRVSHSRALSLGSSSAPSKGQAYLAVLHNTVGDLKRRIEFTYAAESLRLPWLRNACESEDLPFLLLNQILCASTLDQGLTNHLSFDNAKVAGMQTLQLLFGSNNDLPKEFIEFLAGWPNSLCTLKTSPELANWITYISRSLTSLGVLWDSFRRTCIKRGIAPGAREVTETFQCSYSIILPRAVFSSLSRQVKTYLPQVSSRSAEYEVFQTAAFNLFCSDQRKYVSLLGSMSALPPPEHSQAEFTASYLQLYYQHLKGPHQSHTQAVTSTNKSYDLGITNPSRVPNMQPHAAHNCVPSAGGLACVPPDNPAILRRGQFSPPINFNQQQMASQIVQPAMRRGTTHVVVPIFPSQRVPTQSVPQHRRPAPPYLNGSIPNSGHNGPQAAPFSLPQSNSGIGSIRQGTVQGRSVPASEVQAVTAYGGPLRHPLTARQGDIPLLPANHHQNPLLANPVPQYEALHQAHLQQPLTVLSDDLGNGSTRLYQFMDELILGPRRFTSNDSFFTTSFDISGDTFSKVAQVHENDKDPLCPLTRKIGNNSVVLNLRCIQATSVTESILPSTWAALPTYWPEHIFVSLNDHHLEFRRKRQYKRDLPVDITPFVRQGRNTVVISYYAEEKELETIYAIGCETIVFRDTTIVNKLPEKLSAQESLSSILKAMQPATTDDDDDMQIVTDSLVISVADPFSSSLYVTPVRGKTCLHRECFSLETYLDSRTSDNHDPLTSVYQWLCPHCKRDARPCSLVVDGFLQGVCLSLVISGETDTKAIVLKQDGSWTIKREDDSEGQTQPQKYKLAETASKAEAATSNIRAASTSAVLGRANEVVSDAVEVIDLDSD